MTEEPVTLAHVMSDPPPRRRWRWIVWVASILAVLAISATAVFLLRPSGADDLEIVGTLVLDPDDRDAITGVPGTLSCVGSRGYDDIRGGTQVTVTDADGQLIALGRLDDGRPVGSFSLTCHFTFRVTGVPAGRGFYGVEVSHRGVVRFSESELDSDVNLTLGS